MHIADNEGWAALHYSAKNGTYELFTYFSDLEVDTSLKTNDGSNCLHIFAVNGYLDLCKTLVDKYRFDAHTADNDGWTALDYSARNGSYELVTYFADKGIDIYLKTYDGNNCLHIAALYGHLNLCKFFLDNENFDVHMADNDGWTALHNAARNGSFELFLYILGKGSEIYRKTNSMRNVLHLSSVNSRFDICEFILEHFSKDYEDNNIRNQYILNDK